MYDLKENIRKGDILVRQFGYSMTLYDFYKVVDICKSNVKLIRLKSQIVEPTGFMQYSVQPVNRCGYLTKEVINKRFNKHNGISIDKNPLSIYDEDRTYIENHAD